MASSRSASAVVPAWLASPGTSTRQRPCGQMSLPTPTEWPRSTRCRPCSTCSSTNAPIRASVSSSRPRMAGSRPARRIASAIVTPSLSVSPRARSAPRAPVMTRDPAQATPNLAPSSSAKFTTPTGRDGAKPSCRSWSTAARAPTTPSGPSKAPPSGTESRCEPMTTPGSPAATAASGSPHQAHWLPIRSVVRSSPRVSALAGEPLAQVVVLAGPGEPVVPAGLAVDAEGLEVVPHPSEPRSGPAVEWRRGHGSI